MAHAASSPDPKVVEMCSSSEGLESVGPWPARSGLVDAKPECSPTGTLESGQLGSADVNFEQRVCGPLEPEQMVLARDFE